MLARMVSLGMMAFVLSRMVVGFGSIPGEVELALRIQSVSFPGLDYLVVAANWLGQGSLKVIVITLLIVGAMFLARFPAEALLVLVASLCRILNSVIKVWLSRPRPTIDLVNVTEEAVGFGYPSGHAMGATLLFGSLVIVIPAMVKRRWLATLLQALAILMIILTCFSRVYTGAHWPSDVVGGVLIGLVILQPLGWLYHRYRWRIQLHPWFNRPRRGPRANYRKGMASGS